MELNRVHAYLYLHLGAQMPEDAPDTWFLPLTDERSTFIESDAVSHLTHQNVFVFCEEVETLLEDIHDLAEFGDMMNDSDRLSSDDYMTLFYDAAKRTFNGDKRMIRTFFLWLYLIVYQRPEGPRWGDMVVAYGPDAFIAHVRNRLENLL